jgi:hypothetical protein
MNSKCLRTERYSLSGMAKRILLLTGFPSPLVRSPDCDGCTSLCAKRPSAILEWNTGDVSQMRPLCHRLQQEATLRYGVWAHSISFHQCMSVGHRTLRYTIRVHSHLDKLARTNSSGQGGKFTRRLCFTFSTLQVPRSRFIVTWDLADSQLTMTFRRNCVAFSCDSNHLLPQDFDAGLLRKKPRHP